MEFSKAATDKKGQSDSVWVVPAPICVVGNIQNPRYLSGEKEGRERSRLDTREASVALKRAAPESLADYRKHEMLHVVTFGSVEFGKELFVEYCTKYAL